MSEHTPEHTLPRLVDARKLVTVEAHFDRKIAGSDLERLSECCLSIDLVEANIRFGRDEQGRPILSGSINAAIVLECQRCLEPMSYTSTKDIYLVLVWDEAQGKALPKNLDPWIVGEGEVDLVEIIEEDILLSLPVVAKHEHDCLDLSLVDQSSEAESGQEKHNPFSVLADLDLKKQ
jgi:uncharacterized protein